MLHRVEDYFAILTLRRKQRLGVWISRFLLWLQPRQSGKKGCSYTTKDVTKVSTPLRVVRNFTAYDTCSAIYSWCESVIDTLCKTSIASSIYSSGDRLIYRYTYYNSSEIHWTESYINHREWTRITSTTVHGLTSGDRLETNDRRLRTWYAFQCIC